MLYCVEQISAAAQRGAVILTVNQRMTRTLLHGFETWQQQRGSKAWAKPTIFTPAQWWQRCAALTPEVQTVLNAAQQHRIWQRIIRDDLGEHNYALLQAGATVKQALKAYVALCEYRVNVGQYVAVTTEEQAFKRWCSTYQDYCRDHDVIDLQQLPAYVLERFQRGELKLPSEVWLMGFDELSPLLQEFIRILTESGIRVEQPRHQTLANHTQTLCFSTIEAEFSAVMDWAFTHIEQGRSVGVVVPELERRHQVVEQEFRRRQRFAAVTGTGNTEIDINLSLGRPLSSYGVIHVALFLLQLEDPLDFHALSFILRSPWLHGGHDSMQEHMNAEMLLRSCKRSRVSLQTCLEILRHQGRSAASSVRIFTALHEFMSQREQQTPGAWITTFMTVLARAGWPGERSPDSETYQILKAWEDNVATAFVSLDAVEGSIGRVEAARLLGRLCDDTLFQAAARDQRLQVVGLLEGVALACDAVWITGLSDQVMPAAMEFNTFIPVEVQKNHCMPHSSMEREIEFCTSLIEQFCNLAAEVRFSCAGADEDGMVLGPSPFLPSGGSGECMDMQAAVVVSASSDECVYEYVDDTHGLELEPGADAAGGPYAVKGGTYLLKEQAMCPFRAYAHFRLNVHALETPLEGVDMRVRGNLVHVLLQRFWQQVHTQVQLLNMSESQCTELLERLCADMLQEHKSGDVPAVLEYMEARRLVNLGLEWLEQERSRAAFAVVSVEEREELVIGPLKITAVSDRVDQVDGMPGVVLLDYKTGVVKLRDLAEEPLLEPQLPVYALYGRHQPAAGIVIAQVRGGSCSMKGLALAPDAGGDSDGQVYLPVQQVDASEWSELCTRWRNQLEYLAESVVRGCAQVAPARSDLCQFCDLHALCRIQEITEADGASQTPENPGESA